MRYSKGKWLILIGMLCLLACNQKAGQQEANTPSSGEVKLSVDETLYPLLDAEKTIFENLNPKARVVIKYTSETEALKDLVEQTVPVIVVGRQLTEEEKNYIDKKNMVPRYTKIATDAVVAIVNPNNRDTALLFSKLLQIVKGEAKTWKAVNPSSSLGNIDLVFDSQNSGTVSYILNLTQQTALPQNAYATKSNEETLNYVATHPNAIGIIGWSWLSDSDDPITQKFEKLIRIVALTARATDGNEIKTFYKPYQGSLSDGSYPLAREVYIINCEGRSGLGTGFSSYIASQPGQRILLKAGVLPAYMPNRDIEFVNKPLE